MLKLLFLVILLFSLSSCAVGILYTGVHAPRAYRASTPIEVVASKSDIEVMGKACWKSVLGLVAWGDGGYAEAVENALLGKAKDATLYDVKSDVDVTLVMGGAFYKQCTIVSGKVGSNALK